MKKKKLLVVGGGGREHAVSWLLSKSALVEKLYFAPGNAGMAKLGECVKIAANDTGSLVQFAREREIDLTFIGPEEPLVMGIVDRFTEAGLRAFGPTKEASRLEGSKVYAKEFMKRHGIPTAQFQVFDSYEEALGALAGNRGRTVVKADGLAYGKGVVVAESPDEARDAIRHMMVEKKFMTSGNRIVIEEFLEGEEVSIIALTDGEIFLPLVPSQDHKRAFDGDRGPNTGGMGAYAPFHFAESGELEKEVYEILSRTVAGLREDGVCYKGVIYCGLILTKSGPRVLEYNCRLGDPEAQAILPLLKDDLLHVLDAVVEGKGLPQSLTWEDGFCVAVMIASGGYPGSYSTGFPIDGIEEAERGGALVLHAGTGLEKGKTVTKGGRVLSVCAKGKTLFEAQKNAYEACSKISFKGAFCRTDIAGRGIDREAQLNLRKG
ncbi:MAG: phosphoribosylamine--glycine ligase [Candidatus Eisenbacteria bacterium]|nr:phosphoribosylamine--glycine ligase [Candidatus Eisenbacteria bacterium]